MIDPFPDPCNLPGDAPVAIGLDLSVGTLLAAYRKGIFPWYERDQPILWWSPDPRGVLFPERFHCSRRLARRIRQGVFRTTWNTAFQQVMEGCADRDEGTWIHPEMMEAYARLFREGYAHSVEVWLGDALVGGLYGVRLGGIFFAESMFHRETDASKIALFHLVEAAKREGWLLIDCQFLTPHLARLGACAIPRSTFMRILCRAL